MRTWAPVKSYATQMSGHFERHLFEKGDDPEAVRKYFQEWKEAKNEDWYFGKDEFYRKPLWNGKPVLKHVHLAPGPTDKSADGERYLLPMWNLIWEKGWNKERTSNTALIYAEDRTHGFLLLHVVWAPDGHSFPKMLTSHSTQLMNRFRDEAADFMLNGKAPP